MVLHLQTKAAGMGRMDFAIGGIRNKNKHPEMVVQSRASQPLVKSRLIPGVSQYPPLASR